MQAFHMGAAPNVTKRKKQKQKVKQTLSTFVSKPQWRIIPCDTRVAFTIDTLEGDSFFTILESLNNFGSFLHTKSRLFPMHIPNPKIVTLIQDLKEETRKQILKNQILRWKFKRFLTLWKTSKMKRVNDTDFITLSAIEKPVYVYNFISKSMYIFNAKSILHDIHKKLLHHDGEIPTPIFPRNPYTNEVFTRFQVLSIYRQCKEQGNAIWTFEAFVKYSLDLAIFLQYQRKALRMNAIVSMLSNLKDWEGNELLMHFIEIQHEEHEAIFQKAIYRWSIHHMPEEERIQNWVRLCKEYYENDILAEDQSDRDFAFYRITTKSGNFCSQPNELIVKRTLFLQMKKDGTRSSSL